MALDLKVSNDNLVQVYIEDTENATDLSGATVSYDLKDDSGTSQDSGSLSHKGAGSPNAAGQYIFEGIIQDTVSLVHNSSYTLEVTANGGTNFNGFGKFAVLATDRTS